MAWRPPSEANPSNGSTASVSPSMPVTRTARPAPTGDRARGPPNLPVNAHLAGLEGPECGEGRAALADEAVGAGDRTGTLRGQREQPAEEQQDGGQRHSRRHDDLITNAHARNLVPQA